MKLSLKVTVAAIAASLSVAFTTPLSYANGSTDAIYNYYTDTEYSGTQAVASSGLARSVYFTALGKDGVTYSTDTPTENFRQMRSLVDIDQTQQLSLVMTLTNTTAAPLAINNTYSTPKQNYDSLNNKDNAPIVVATSIPTVSVTPGTFTAETGVRIVESGVGANTFVDYPTRAQNVNNITQIAFIGTLDPGQSVTVTLPLELTNLADLDLVQGRYAFVRETMRIGRTRASAEEINTSIRFAHRITYNTSTGINDTLTSTGQYIGAVLEDRSGTRVYSAVPADIQNLMPNMTANDITIRNFQCDTVNPCEVRSATDEPVLYTGGLYYIDLARIKTALAGTGWSVNNLKADELADFYSYYTGGAATVTDYTTGEVINNGSVDKYGTVHTELFQYIEAHDLTIYVGDPYQPNNTLDWIRDYQKVVLATAQDDLSTISNISVVNTVDNTTVGVYPVTYKLHFSDGEVVYKTIKVTVLDRPTPPVTPTVPPVEPTTPPLQPTTPPVEPTNPPLNIPDENRTTAASTPKKKLARTGSESTSLTYLAGISLALGVILNRRRMKSLD